LSRCRSARSVGARVAMRTESAPSAWVRACCSVLNLEGMTPSVSTDCEGIGAAVEGVRLLRDGGCIVGYHHLMSSEIDEVGLMWQLTIQTHVAR
jgi:hypothetical protein